MGGRRARLRRLTRVGLLERADVEVMAPVQVVEELIVQEELVVVTEAVEGADRVGVICPSLVAWDVPLDTPGLAPVERLVEAENVVVAFRAAEPLGGADQVKRVCHIDADIRLRM